MIPKPCLTCGEPTNAGRCPDCHLNDRRTRDNQRTRDNTTTRGYDTTWRKLSERARRLQPWCTDCGAVDDLTADHSPEAWHRKHNGKPIRLQDIDVVCRRCNARRGRAKPAADQPDTQGRHPKRHPSRLRPIGVEANEDEREAIP
ncbi:hypothetical protein [Gordonia aichiensis]|uniref:hypothetical protein n=1 Tax=Gordonia aichiensis TaxID=36820 RepID=UPI003262D90F